MEKPGHKGRNHGTATAQYWLIKSEPTAFSIQDLRKATRQTTCWDGVRNYQARNFMRAMRLGEGVLFYHSNADPPAIVGTAEVVREAYPDHSAFDRQDVHFDPRSTPEKPLWDMVDVRLVRVFPRQISLEELRHDARLKHMELLRKGSRLSVQPVRPEEWTRIVSMVEEEGR